VLGVVAGALVLLMLALCSLHPHEASSPNLVVSLRMGALRTIVNVTRMATADGFNLEFEVGRKSVRQLGGLRPLLAAIVYRGTLGTDEGDAEDDGRRHPSCRREGRCAR
jgi:hypothetical protein